MPSSRAATASGVDTDVPSRTACPFCPCPFYPRERHPQLVVHAPRRVDHVVHPHGLVRRSGEEGGVERDRPDRAAGDRHRRQRGGVQAARRRAIREGAPPDRLARGAVREREADDGAQPPQEGFVHGVLQVARQDGDPSVGLDALEEVADLGVGVAVARVLDLAALAEQRVRLVEQQDGASRLRRVEDGLNLPELPPEPVEASFLLA